MATAGKVAPTPKDKFVNGTAYDKLDVVEYNGTLYIAKKASAGVLPTDTEYWMLAVDLTGKLDTTGDTENNTVTFESSDEADPTAWKNVNVLSSKEKHSSLLKKISTMFSNVRYLYKLLGTTDISALGTVTQALANLDGNVGDIKGIISSLADCSAATVAGYAADALAVKELNSNLKSNGEMILLASSSSTDYETMIVDNLNNYKCIVVAVCEGNYYRPIATTIYPLSFFKKLNIGGRTATTCYHSEKDYFKCDVFYVNDTEVQLKVDNIGIVALFGII